MTSGETSTGIEALRVDGVDYPVSDLTASARAQIVNINYCDRQIAQLQNELAVADTARLAYIAALKNGAK